MTAFEITTNAAEKAEQLRRFPDLIDKYLRPAVDHSTGIMARSAKRNAIEQGATAHQILVNSINKELSADGLEGVVRANTSYAVYVEEGTRGGGYPPHQTVIDWLRVKHITPRTPGMTEDELAFLISRDIALNGTPAKPFMQPAFDSEKDATFARLNAAIDKVIAEIGA